MGGSINVVIRDHDGVVYKQERWTNAMPLFFNDVRFLERDPEFLRKYLLGARANLEFIAPVGYGLVVADYRTNTLLDWQGYTGQFAGIFDRFAFGKRGHRDDLRELAQVLFAKGRTANALLRTLVGDKTWSERLVPVSSIAEADALADASPPEGWRGPDAFDRVIFDRAPWTYVDYPETGRGLNDMKARLLDLEFEVSLEKWAEFEKEREA